jgi:hypothetical protein
MVITWVYFFYIQLYRTYLHSRKVKWITSYNTTIIKSTSNETTDVTRNPTSIVEEGSPDNMTKTECGCSWTVCALLHSGATWTERWPVKQRDASENRASKDEGESERDRQTGHEQTAIGVRRALRLSITARNQAHKSKSIDGRTERRKSHLIIIWNVVACWQYYAINWTK